MQAHAAEFSSDGSLLFVSFGRVLTVWDPEENSLEQVLSYTLSESPVNQMAFSRDSIFLIASSETHLYVWNLLTCTVWWCMPLKVQWIKNDPYSNRFMVVTESADEKISQELHLFDTASPMPIYSRLISADQPQLLASTFVMNKGQSDVLLLNDLHKFTVWSQQPASKTEASDVSSLTKIHQKSEKSKLFSNLFGGPGVRPAAVTPGASPVSVRVSDSTLASQFLTIPTTMAPTPLSFVGEFLSSFLTSSSSAATPSRTSIS
jgi:NET1-associated nuclear protein 1 (U3 small nucleolar RNA-associated protein 17)